MNKKLNVKHLFIIFVLPLFCFGQKEKDSLLTIWENIDLDYSIRANAYKQYIQINYMERKTDSAYFMTNELIDFTKDHRLSKQKADALILLGNINHIYNDNSAATDCFLKALEVYVDIGDTKGRANAIHSIGNSYRKLYNLDEAKEHYEESLKLSKQINDTSLIAMSLMSIGNIYAWRYKSSEAIEFYDKSIKLYEAINDQRGIASTILNIAAASNNQKKFNISKQYSFKSIKIADSIKNYKILSDAYANICSIHLLQKQYDSVIKYADKVLFYAKEINLNYRIDGAYYFFAEAYKGQGNFEETLKYYDLRKEQNTTMEDIKTSRVLEKIKIDNLRYQDSLINVAKALKTEMVYQKEKTNLTLAWGGSLSALSLFAFIIFRNTKRKQRKAERERQQEIEEKEKILKDLELSTIDAMIQGQEKERQRLAEDLHDSVGATLTAAKMQFEYLIKHQNDAKASEALIKKTSTLLENAYVEIRSMAHLKNSGVMAKNGLLPAVEKLSTNASGLNGLSFTVNSHGLDQRLENAVEITVFRIIQELTTNVIKHANATEASIHLTNHEDSLNIMVEDNGKGFNPSQITKTKSGMGISSINKRVAHLGGKMTIESEANKGTTVIIDIPL